MEEELAAVFEEERLERLAKLDAHYGEDDPDWQQSYARSRLSIHEALHTTHIFGRMLHEHLEDHPVIVLHPHLYQLASQAGYALAELYQAIGNVVPHDEEERP
jgi:hypothetical protein